MWELLLENPYENSVRNRNIMHDAKQKSKIHSFIMVFMPKTINNENSSPSHFFQIITSVIRWYLSMC
jgi:hypothetical protein